jgi:hypothetical protein
MDSNFRQMVESIRIASVVNGKEIDSVEAAKQVKALIGSAKAEGVQSAKTTITVTKRSQPETKGSSQTKPQPSKADKLSSRLKAGEDQAFAELFELWQEEGKL